MNDAPGPQAAPAALAAPVGARPKRQRRWLRVLVVAVVVAALVGGAELTIRSIATGVIASAIRDELSLTEDHPVAVTVGGPAVVHALSGNLGDVSVAVDDVPVFDGIAVSLAAHADTVPFDVAGRPLSGAQAVLTIPKAQLGPVIALATGGLASTGEVRNGVLVVGRSVELFGQTVPLNAKIEVDIVDGELAVTPRGVSAAGFTLSADELERLTGSLLEGVLEPQRICVNDRIPAGVQLTSIELSSLGAARVTAQLAPSILSDPSQQALGSCGE